MNSAASQSWIISPHAWLDATHAPLYIARLPQHMSDSELASYLETLERFLLNHDGPYVVVTDTSFVQSAPAIQRRMIADSDIRLRDHDEKWCAGVAVIAKSAFMRGVVTAIYWISPPVYPYRILPSLSEAIVWGRQQLDTWKPAE